MEPGAVRRGCSRTRLPEDTSDGWSPGFAGRTSQGDAHLEEGGGPHGSSMPGNTQEDVMEATPPPGKEGGSRPALRPRHRESHLVWETAWTPGHFQAAAWVSATSRPRHLPLDRRMQHLRVNSLLLH
ncbi:uncharacterized protein [Equus przewalskii]|uniref:Uncharacterized protein n=1 Tax=Equus przewalskii TaxID=9798 RepID=A0ABM4MDA5_EQUPR